MREIEVTNNRIYEEAIYMLNHKATVRQTGAHFGRSKSAIHKDMRERLPHINRTLATEVAKLMKFNLDERAKRGGASTGARWKRIKGEVV